MRGVCVCVCEGGRGGGGGGLSACGKRGTRAEALISSIDVSIKLTYRLSEFLSRCHLSVVVVLP